MLLPAGRFYVPKSCDHSDHGKLLAGPLLVWTWPWDLGKGVTPMSWWDFLTLLFGPSRRSATRRRSGSLYLLRNTLPEDTSRLRRAWRWMRATG